MKHLFMIKVLLWVIAFAGTARGTTLWKVSNVTELNQAISELKATCPYGGTIILAPGTYLMNQTVDFNSIHLVNIVGSGWNTIWQKVGAGDAIRFINSSFSRVYNIRIVGDLNATQGSGLIFREQGSSSCVVDYCRIEQFAESGIRFEGTAQLPLSTNTVSNCHLIGNRVDQFYSFNNNDFFITRNQFGTHQSGQTDPNGPVPRTGVVLDHSSAGTYSHNYHWDNTIAFKMGPGSHYNRIEHNRFEESRQSGIVIGDSNGGDVSILNIFLGNTIHSNSKFNSGKYTAVVAYNASDITFCANQIFSWNSQQTLMKQCLEISSGCTNWIVKHNIMAHSAEQPALAYNSGAGHIVKDNIIQIIEWIQGDLNKDNKVDILDLAILAENWLIGT